MVAERSRPTQLGSPVVVMGAVVLLGHLPAMSRMPMLLKLCIDFTAGAALYLVCCFALKLRELEFIRMGAAFVRNK